MEERLHRFHLCILRFPMEVRSLSPTAPQTTHLSSQHLPGGLPHGVYPPVHMVYAEPFPGLPSTGQGMLEDVVASSYRLGLSHHPPNTQAGSSFHINALGKEKVDANQYGTIGDSNFDAPDRLREPVVLPVQSASLNGLPTSASLQERSTLLDGVVTAINSRIHFGNTIRHSFENIVLTIEFVWLTFAVDQKHLDPFEGNLYLCRALQSKEKQEYAIKEVQEAVKIEDKERHLFLWKLIFTDEEMSVFQFVGFLEVKSHALNVLRHYKSFKGWLTSADDLRPWRRLSCR